MFNAALKLGCCCLWVCLLAGCGPRLSAEVRAEAFSSTIPRNVTWALVCAPAPDQPAPKDNAPVAPALPAPGLPNPAQAALFPIIDALAYYGWRLTPLHVPPMPSGSAPTPEPSGSGVAPGPDVLVRVWWNVSEPLQVLEPNPFFRGPGYGMWAGSTWGRASWGNRWGRDAWGRAPLDPWGRTSLYGGALRVETVFERRLMVEALHMQGLPSEVRETLALWNQGTGDRAGRPLSWGAGPAFTGTGFAPAPEHAVLWQVAVSSVGSSPRLGPLLTMLSAAAARYIGVTAEVSVRVNGDLEVNDAQ